MFMCLYFHRETKIRKIVHVYMFFFLKQTSTPHPQGQIETLLVGIYKHKKTDLKAITSMCYTLLF